MTWAREKKWKESYDTTTTTTKNFWLIKENSDAEFAKNHLKLYNVFWPIWILILKKRSQTAVPVRIHQGLSECGWALTRAQDHKKKKSMAGNRFFRYCVISVSRSN